MRLSALESGAVECVVREAHDIEDIFALHGHRNLRMIVDAVMAQAAFAWLAWDGDAPVTVFGASQTAVPAVWSTFLLTRPSFGRVAIPLTRFVKKAVIPVLFGDLHARRLQADLHEKHIHIHRWVKALGAVEEGRMKDYSPCGDYLRFALCRSSWLDKSDKTC